MGHAEWGSDPEFFGPRHAHREGRILRTLGADALRRGPHLECAAGVGSLSIALARRGRTVVAADLSLRSLAEVARRARSAELSDRVLPVLCDIHRLPFADGTFSTVTSAETLEHIPDHGSAAGELARTVAPGGVFAGTVPAGPGQWSDWDEWADHQRRYRAAEMDGLLRRAGLEADVKVYGWPVLRSYDELFLKRVNRRRLRHDGPVESDSGLRTVAGLGRRRWLVRLVRLAFELDRLFDGVPWGVGLLYRARKPSERRRPGP